MKPKLRSKSKKQWLKAVLNDFDSFLQDHADNERKASAMALSFVAKYPNRVEIIPQLIATGLEELGHFQQVYKLMEKRGVQLTHELAQDLYIKNLVWLSRSGRQERFLDRMIIAAVVEARGAERFRLVSEALEDKALKKFYLNLAESEDKHGDEYLTMVSNYFSEDVIKERLAYFEKEEAKILEDLEITASLH